jgi:hypothetical protein
MSIINISPISTGIVVLTQEDSTPTIITINQGQQGPAGVSLSIDNYGDNRLTTSDGTASGLYAESGLTFDGILRVSGVGVSLSGHSHNLSDIVGISGAISSGVLSTLSNLSTIVNECDVEYILIQDSGNNSKLINISSLADAISIIDGGGVSYSGC